MTDANPTMDDLTRVIEEQRAAWNDLVAEVGEDRLREPGAMGDWTFKDLAAHLTGWRERTLRFLEAAAQGEPQPRPPWPAELDEDNDADLDAINDWIHEQNKDRPAADVLAEADASFDRLATAVRAIPIDEIRDPQRFSWLEGTSLGQAIMDRSLFSHYPDEHEAEVRHWLAAGR